MIRRKSKNEVRIGDVYAVPLDPLNQRYGYVRMYHNPDIAILGVTSGKQLLSLDEVKKYPSVTDAFSMRTAIEKGRWPLIGNIPFASEDEAWPGPRKQVFRLRPDVRKVVFKGRYISAEEFGQYDDLPEDKKLTDERLIEEINENSNLFKHIDT
ncbi:MULTISPECIES: Imm26 family immunity protein [Burkholderia]|uniref:Imm26 family immunity protein n=1 Tax=Burkholderia TaxID=32008 RepID=UPI000946E5FF|nr:MULTISPECIES: Imm26 family immunity protein [Burkholderia]